MLNFYDFEVYAQLWCVTFMNPVDKTEVVIINDREKLVDYYKNHKDQIFIGYNSRNYDSIILKSILLNFDVKKINDYIIYQGMKSWQIDKRLNQIQLYDYDVMTMRQGLKQLEGFMGNDIRETEIPFDYNGEFTPDMIQQVIKYNKHDVEQTIEVFLNRKADFDAQIDLIKTFNKQLSFLSKTKAQLTASILNCSKTERCDEWDIQIVDVLKIEKYKNIVDWFKSPLNHNYNNALNIEVCGVPHIFGWGGLHGAPAEPLHIKGCLLHIDVTSYYPSIMIEYDFLTRNCTDKDKFKQIYDKRVELKKQGKKKEQAPYKIILNSTYGITKDKFNPAYDPRQANNVCINGQLMLLDLLEHLEGHCKIIQSNTDGLIIQIDDTDAAFNKIDDICFEWEQRTKMSLGFDFITEIWQKDVNNYIFKFDNGKLERKGAYVKELDDLDNDLPIVNEAIVKYLTEGVEPEITINNCNDLKMFQKIVKVSNKYLYGTYNGIKQNDKTFRVFASKDFADGIIGKVKIKGGKIEKFANTPDHCFIYNNSVNGVIIPDKLNKNYYIDMVIDRLEQFGQHKRQLDIF